jgi:hypothetical protein
VQLSRFDGAKFKLLQRSWAGQCEAYSENFDDFAPQQLNHAERICTETSQENNYGIFCLEENSRFEAIMHVNVANIPGFKGAVLRILWILMAPEYDFGDASEQKITRIASSLINEALRLSDSELKSDHIKIHLGNISDRQYFHNFSELLKGMPYFTDSRVVGNWFHLSKNV